MLKSYEVKLDLENNLYSPMATLFEVSNEDLDTVAISFSITQDDKPFDLTGTTVELAIKKPSGLTVYQDCEIVAAAAGTATTLLSSQAYIEYGIYTAEVYIRTVDQIAVTCPFWYAARQGILNDTTLESSNDWTALQEALLAYDKKPVLVEAVPDFVPEYIGQTALDTVGRRAFIAMGALATDWQVLGAATGGGGLVSWGDILGKPTTFPPSAHTHTIADIVDFVTGVAANIPAEYLTQTEADARYQAAGTAPDLTGYETTAHAAATYQPIGNYLTAVPPEYLTTTEADAAYQPKGDYITTTAADAAYLSQTEGDARYQQIGTDTPDDWTEITGKPAAFPPSAHTHTSADITDFAAAVAADIPAEYLTQTEGDARYSLKGTTGTASSVDWGNVTGDITLQTDLQNALAAKADDTDLANYAPVVHTHTAADISDFVAAVAANIPAEYLTSTEGDAAYQPKGAYLTSVTWTDVTGKPTTFAPSAHTHASTDITDFAAAVAAAIPAAYLTDTEADAVYQPKGAYLTAVTWTDVTGKPTTFAPSAHTHLWADITDKPTTFAPAAHTHAIADITNLQSSLDAKDEKPITGTAAPTAVPAYVGQIYVNTTTDEAYIANGTTAADWQIISASDWTEITNKPTTFAPSAHTHLWADITDKPTTFTPSAHTHAIADVTNLQTNLDAKAPLASPALTGTPTAPTAAAGTNTTQIASTAFVQGQGFLKTVPLMSGTAIGGAMVGNGLGMSGNYLFAKTGAGLGIAADNSIQVQTTNATPTAVRFWTGNQAAYDAIATKDATTLYFITP